MDKQMQIKKVFNSFRGITYVESELANDIWTVALHACSQDILAKILTCDIWCNAISYDAINVEYSIMFEDKDWENLIKTLKLTLETFDIGENMNEIEQYNLFDDLSKEKYVDYIKYHRSRYTNGLDEHSAKEILDNCRFCSTYNKELYTKSDEIRAILESETPERAHEILVKTIHDDD